MPCILVCFVIEPNLYFIINFFVSDRLMVEVSGVALDEATAMQFIKKLDLPGLKAESIK
jgi:hypothetical protein